MSEAMDAARLMYDLNPERATRSRAIVDALLAEITLAPDMRAMDYGCGNGQLTLALHPHVAEVVAADISEQALAELSGYVTTAKVTNVRPVRLDLENEESDERGFDLAVSSMAFHHMRAPQTVLSKLATMLVPGGFVGIADLGGGSEAFHVNEADVYHHGFSAEEMQEMFAAAGLVEVRVQEATRMRRETGEFPVLLTVGRRP